jgi:formate dehydrogenase iron-sulfur subunit
MSTMGILTDVTRCIGCEECVAACKKTNQTGKDRPWRWQRNVQDLSASRWTTIKRFSGDHYVRQQCRHCLEPACASACPVGALHKMEDGAVVYDSNVCMGCRYCMMACPFGIPRYLWSAPVPYVRKCILCHDKIADGELDQPACTSACPAEATIYGPRDALLEEARKRIRDNPGRYIDKIWGEHEVGGTSVLYISDIPLDFLGWKKDLGQDPLPAKTWAALRQVPYVFGGVGIGMVGLHWIIGRRQKLAQVSDPDTPPEPKEKEASEQSREPEVPDSGE